MPSERDGRGKWRVPPYRPDDAAEVEMLRSRFASGLARVRRYSTQERRRQKAINDARAAIQELIDVEGDTGGSQKRWARLLADFDAVTDADQPRVSDAARVGRKGPGPEQHWLLSAERYLFDDEIAAILHGHIKVGDPLSAVSSLRRRAHASRRKMIRGIISPDE